MTSVKRIEGHLRNAVLIACVTMVALTAVCAPVAAVDSGFQFELKLIIEPDVPGLELDVWVEPREVTVGDAVEVCARTNKNAYVYIFNVNPEGKVYPLIPNPREKVNFVRAGQILRLPRGNYRITADTPGREYLVAIATLTPINPESYWIKRAMDVAELGKPFTSTAEDFLRSLKFAELQPFHYGAYAATVYSFDVQDPFYSRLGNLSITSSPQGALAFVDGRHVGTTPCVARDLTAGYHEVTLVKDGYRTVVEMVGVRAMATEYKSFLLTKLGTLSPPERVVFGPWRLEIKRERDGDTRSFLADLGYSGMIQVRPKETFDSKLYQVEVLFTLRPGETTSQVLLVLSDTAQASDRGRTVSRDVGPFRVLTTIEDIELVDRGSIFSSRYIKSITLSIQVVWTGAFF